MSIEKPVITPIRHPYTYAGELINKFEALVYAHTVATGLRPRKVQVSQATWDIIVGYYREMMPTITVNDPPEKPKNILMGVEIEVVDDFKVI